MTHQWINCCFEKAVEERITVGYLSTALCGVASLSCVYCFRWLYYKSRQFWWTNWKKVREPVSTWPIEKFKSNSNQHFLILPNEILMI